MLPTDRTSGPKRSTSSKLLLLVSAIALLFLSAEPFRAALRAGLQEIPRTWDEEALVDFELPPPDPSMTVEHISAEYYYGIPERVIYKTYPMYHPDFEPEGYLDSLATLDADVVLDMDTIDTDEEWSRAGEMVFGSPQLFIGQGFSGAEMASLGMRPDSSGIYPELKFVVLGPGNVQIGAGACADCHSRVMPDGSVVKGAQGLFEFDRGFALLFGRALAGAPNEEVAALSLRALGREQYGAPWIDHASQHLLDTISAAGYIEALDAVPGGVLTRQGTNLMYPTRIPDLRGIRNRRYLDATGLMQHRSIGDLMRYAAFNQFVDHLNRYGDFVPSLGNVSGPLPPPDSVASGFNGPFTRFSDAQAYALARYLYSLEPLPSPHQIDDATQLRGEQVFAEAGCVSCHPPPDFTNNQLTPALGFIPPDDHYDRFDIFDVSVETDPGLAMYTRRGTGYYKIPSLRGLWYRSHLLHDGSITTLEELLDPARLEDSFEPSGFKGAGVTSRAVPGHPFGFELDADAKQALIAYLLTL